MRLAGEDHPPRRILPALARLGSNGAGLLK
jgi:hypothetical protein